MKTKSLDVQPMMFGFSLEAWTSSNPPRDVISVKIPALFPSTAGADKPKSKTLPTTTNVFINNVKLLTDRVGSRNYLDIPHNFPKEIGVIKRGDRLLIAFPDGDIRNPVIIGKG